MSRLCSSNCRGITESLGKGQNHYHRDLQKGKNRIENELGKAKDASLAEQVF